MGSGISGDGYVYSLMVYNDQLIAGGDFFGNEGFAAWNGSSWQSLGGAPIRRPIRAMTVYNGELILGGAGSSTPGISCGWARRGLPQVIEGDLNHDCSVDYSDLERFADNWLLRDCESMGFCNEADLNYDRQVDFRDYAEFATNWTGPKILGDIDIDWDVDFVDFAIFAKHFMERGCADPNWCGGADLNKSKRVNMVDLFIFAEHWLEGQ